MMATELANLVAVRLMLPSDAPFVTSFFVDSYYDAKKKQLEKDFGGAASIDSEAYKSALRLRIGKLVSQSAVIVGCSPSDASEAFGYVVFERLGNRAVLHWLYVKHPFRRLGFGRALYLTARGNCSVASHSHATPLGSVLAKKWGSTFNPELAR